MRRTIIGLFCLIALSVAAIPAGAQTRSRYVTEQRYDRSYDQRSSRESGIYDQSRLRNQSYNNRSGYYDYGYDNRSVWDRSRDKITTAAGAGAGAVIGGLIGGGKGAIIGAIAGGGGAALYTYKIRDKYGDYRY